MPPAKRDSVPGRGSTPRNDGRSPNGDRSKFRTDAAISNNRFGAERTLQPWVPDSGDGLDGSLEKSSGSGPWDQFAENKRLFGLTTDYDENIYTTVINKNHPQYRERKAVAEKMAAEIERSTPTTAHVAEERVMDYVPGTDRGDENEEDKYSGVRRQDLPPLAGRENKYTPPAKRAPSSQTTVKGAPVDPAIISSQIRAPAKKQSSPAPEDSGPRSAESDAAAQIDGQNHADTETTDDRSTETRPATSSPGTSVADGKDAEKVSTPARTSASASRNMSPHVKDGTPSATSTVEVDVLKEFKTFASQQRMTAEKVRASKAKADKEVKLTELKKFANNFKLSTPVPTDLVSIIAKDPSKQKEIQAKAIRNAEDIAKAKAESAVKEKVVAAKDTQAKATEQNSGTPASDTRSSRVPTAPHGALPAGGPNRHPGSRQQQFSQQQYHTQPYRNNRGGPLHVPSQQTGNLAQRLRNVEQQKFSQPPAAGLQHAGGQDVRAPPTGPANNVDPNFNSRRASAVPMGMGPRLNPNSNEFRPSPFAPSFNPNSHASAGSSPRSAVNNVADSSVAAPQLLVRRKTKAIDVKKCFILAHIKTFTPPLGRNWNDNGGLRPSYDTLPTWRQLQDNEARDSTMHLTYKERFEQQPFSSASLATPNPTHAVPQMPHQHQLPFHLQHGAHNMGPRQSPHMPPMQMHAPQHAPVQQPQFGNDEHRMMHSNSAQSFASPRLGQVSMAYSAMNSPAQMQYNQPVYMGPGMPQMGHYPRSFSNNPQYMPPQQGQMGPPMMMQQQFIQGPQGMVAAPQMMYPGGQPQFMPPSGPPQAVPGMNGYPSPGRPAAPMMAHQGSQQGQPMYGMSPNVQYNQPAYGPQVGGPMSNMRGYSSPGPQHYGTSPQQGHHYVPQQRSNSNNYNKNFVAHGQHQAPQGNQVAAVTPPAASQGRGTDGSDEAK